MRPLLILAIFGTVMLVARLGIAAPITYPDTSISSRAGLTLSMVRGANASKAVLSGWGTLAIARRHRVGANLGIAFGEQGDSSQTVFFHHLGADYYFRAIETNLNDLEFELRLGMFSGLTTLRWTEFEPDLVLVRPAIATYVEYLGLWILGFGSVQYDALQSEVAQAWFKSLFDLTADLASDSGVETLDGLTIGYNVADELALFLEFCIDAALYPEFGFYSSLTPGLTFIGTGFFLSFGWQFPLDDNAQRLYREYGSLVARAGLIL